MQIRAPAGQARGKAQARRERGATVMERARRPKPAENPDPLNPVTRDAQNRGHEAALTTRSSPSTQRKNKRNTTCPVLRLSR